MRHIELKKIQIANGETIGYREAAGGSEVILFLHGNLTTSKYWERFMGNLPEAYHAYAVDLRGAGSSSYQRPVENMRQFSEDVFLLAREIGLTRFTLVGLSMGGLIGMQMTADHPALVKNLILVDSPPCTGLPLPTIDESFRAVQSNFWQQYQETMTDPLRILPLARKAFDQAVFNYVPPEMPHYADLASEIFTIRNYPDCVRAAQLFNISPRFNGLVEGTGEVDKITIPVLIIVGEHDVLVNLDMARATAADIGENAEVVVIKDAGHCSFLDNQPEVMRAMIKFLEK